MKVKRLLRGGRREYDERGLLSLFSILVWFVTRTVAPSLRSYYYTRLYPREIEDYGIPLDPYDLVRVDPATIRYETERERGRWASFARNLGSVRDGEWDRTSGEPFSDKHQSFRAHFADGVAWEETELYADAIEAVSNGEYTLRMATSRAEVLQRCREIDALYDSIRTEGYRTQAELGTYQSKLHQLGNEIQVDVGRDGALLLVEGRHRLSLAKILGIEEVPVIVVCRHEEWVERLEECYRRGEPLDHPDWRNIEDG